MFAGKITVSRDYVALLTVQRKQNLAWIMRSSFRDPDALTDIDEWRINKSKEVSCIVVHCD